MTTGSFVISSHAMEYRVSKLERTTPLKSAGGYSRHIGEGVHRTFAKFLARLDVGEGLTRHVHRHEGVEVNVRVHRGSVGFLFADRRPLCAGWGVLTRHGSKSQHGR